VTPAPPGEIMSIMSQDATAATATGPGCPVDESFDPLSPEFLADPYAVNGQVARPRSARLLRPVDRLLRLLEDPSRWAEVVQRPALIPGAVEESLRCDPSVTVWRRVTTRPVTLAGVNLPEGARLFLTSSSPSTPTSRSAAPRSCW
jgi:hypothetical protein